jgi:hypothetical protein
VNIECGEIRVADLEESAPCLATVTGDNVGDTASPTRGAAREPELMPDEVCSANERRGSAPLGHLLSQHVRAVREVVAGVQRRHGIVLLVRDR